MGTAVGIVLGWFLNQRSEDDRRKYEDARELAHRAHEDEIRWHADRRVLYARILASAGRCWDHAYMEAAIRDSGRAGYERQQLESATAEYRAAMGEIRLLAPPLVRDAGTALLGVIQTIDHMAWMSGVDASGGDANINLSDETSPWVAQKMAFTRTIAEFERLARADLKIEGSEPRENGSSA